MGHGCATAAQSVRLLTDLLYVYYGQKPIILLDEYDTPLQEAYFNSFWDEMTAFVGAFLIIPLKRIHRWGEHC